MRNRSKKTIIITGAGSGIGRAIAIRLAKDGYSIGLIGRRAGNLKQTEKIIKKITPDVIYKTADVRKKDQVYKAVEYISSHLGKLSGAVAAAGIGGSNKPTRHDRWDNVIKTNLYGTYYALSAAVQYMKNDNEPKQLISIASLLARIGVKNYTAYCASKSGILGLVRALAIGLADKGIRVNAISPGWVDTKMAKRGMNRLARINNLTYENARKNALNAVPLKRMSSPEEIANVVSFLFGEGISGFTGQNFDISNGSWME
ncbi:MAG: SDR family oxidoreductase [Candidatus Jorgensenbacteria bacterium]